MKRKFLTLAVLLGSTSVFAQGPWFTNGNIITPANWLGSQNNQPLNFRTNNIQRMKINGTTTFAGVNTTGFIGIATNNPLAPLTISGSQNIFLNAQSWRRGLNMVDRACINFDAGPPQNGQNMGSYFLGFPSSNPPDNFFTGISAGQSPSATVNYCYQIYVNTQLGTSPIGSTHFFKNVLIQDNTFERSFGVNTFSPARVTDIHDTGNDNITDAQLRLTTVVNSAYTDFRNTSLGNLLINPSAQKVGINLITDPTANLDVNGNVRIRNVPIGPPNCLIIGENVTVAGDVNVRRLDFTGSNNQVLLGNGTWGTLPSGGYFRVLITRL